MQLYAVDGDGKKISAREALGGVDYLCFECNGRMRTRKSSLGTAHFFHLRSDAKCRQNGKSEEHIFLQELLLSQIRAHSQEVQIESQAELESPFPEIGRIADVAWHKRKIVFEVQCSPISVQEVKERCADYEKVGWYVVWILLSSTFYRQKLKNVAYFLQGRTHYYANALHGEIFDLIHPHYVRDMSGYDRRFVVDIGTIQAIGLENAKRPLPRLISKRLASWSYCSKGDLVWQAIEGSLEPSLVKILNARKVKRRFYDVLLFIRSAWYLILETALRSRMH
jgi:competence protein CoiA